MDDHLSVVRNETSEEVAQTVQALARPKRLTVVEWCLEPHATWSAEDPDTCEMEPTRCDFVERVDRLGVETLTDAGINDCQRRDRPSVAP